MFNGLKEKVTLVDMERKLIADKDGNYKREILNKLSLLDGEVSKKISQGLSKDEFDVFNKLKIAIKSAKHTITNF